METIFRTVLKCLTEYAEYLLKNSDDSGFRDLSGAIKQALIDRLRINHNNGIVYHKPDKTPGDYDVFETEEEIYRLIRFGTSKA